MVPRGLFLLLYVKLKLWFPCFSDTSHHCICFWGQAGKEKDKSNGDFAYILGTIVILVREDCLPPEFQAPAQPLLLLWGCLEAGWERMKKPNKENLRGSPPYSMICSSLHSCSLHQKQRPFLGALSLSACGAHFCFQSPYEPMPRNAGGRSPRKFNASCMVLWAWFPCLLPFIFQSHQRAAHVSYVSFELPPVGRTE